MVKPLDRGLTGPVWTLRCTPMTPAVATVDLVQELYRHCMLLLVINVLISGIAILLAWRGAYWKAHSENLEAELEKVKHARVDEEPTPIQLPTLARPPVPRGSDLRRIPATKFTKRQGP